jgi:acid phosphatase type 7
VRPCTLGLVVMLVCGACGGTAPTGPSVVDPAPGIPPTTPGQTPAPTPVGPQVFVGAGDVSVCDQNAEATARLLDGIGGTIFMLGDGAYFQGTRQQYRDCYGPTWGRHRARTRPVPGNHDYESPLAAPYFEYFGERAAPPDGFYSFELGAWHAVALNSNIPMGPGSYQAEWLRADLASTSARCVIAYWHHPLFSSGPDGNQAQARELWRILYAAGADVVLNGHDHFYERWAPQDPDGRSDPSRGIRQFTVGTGGAPLYQRARTNPLSEVLTSAFGVLRLTLAPGTYQWEFVPVLASVAHDRGSGECH